MSQQVARSVQAFARWRMRTLLARWEKVYFLLFRILCYGVVAGCTDLAFVYRVETAIDTAIVAATIVTTAISFARYSEIHVEHRDFSCSHLTCAITCTPFEFLFTISTQIAPQVPKLLDGAKYCRKVQPSEQGARTSQTDDRRTDSSSSAAT